MGTRGRKRHVCYEADGFYIAPSELTKWEHGAISYLRGRKVVKIDIADREALLDNGERIKFGKCLIATGLLLAHD